MKDLNFVSADKLETLEQYAGSLLSGIVSLKTLESFHLVAHKKGLLNEDEEENSKSICWEIHRLLSLYQIQMKFILDRTEITREEIIDAFKAQMPNVKLPRKRKKKDAENT
jgi:hypothetical protein